MTGERAALESALRAAGVEPAITAQRDSAGGCVSRVVHLELASAAPVVAKLEPAGAVGRLEEEAAGLRALGATGAVLVPNVHAVGVFEGVAILLMEAIEAGRASSRAWRSLGEDLAALHGTAAGSRYGFAHDNHLGSTPQANAWADDWVAFNATCRLGPQLRRARDAGRLEAAAGAAVESVIRRLDRYLPRRPHPALLHGDLWSGNALPAVGERVALIDPACSIGDGWADVAMMQLFGGFPAACHAAYAEAIGGEPDGLPARLAIYQLYHALNHVNLFGSGYVPMAMQLARRLA